MMSYDEAMKTATENAVRFLSLENVKQKEVAEKSQISETQVSKVKTGNTPPNLQMIYYLCSEYQIPFEDFMTRKLSDDELKAYVSHTQNTQEKDLRKYTGTYSVFYFSNGEDIPSQNTLENSLDYGLIHISMENASFRPELKVDAVMGIHEREQIQAYKEKLAELTRSSTAYSTITEYFDKHVDTKHRYRGSLLLPENTYNYISINLYHDFDTAQILLPRPSLFSRDAYLGGLGTLNSLSKRKFNPCLQCIALSRPNIDTVSVEEIAHHLYMKSYDFSNPNIQSLVSFIECCYKNQFAFIESEHITTIVKAYIESYIEKSITNSQFRYFQIQEEDMKWYTLIKKYLEGGRHGNKKQ